MIYKEFRPDGFPLCPDCGQDELYTLDFIDIDYSMLIKPIGLEDYLRARLKCYGCTFDSLMEKYVSKTK